MLTIKITRGSEEGSLDYVVAPPRSKTRVFAKGTLRNYDFRRTSLLVKAIADDILEREFIESVESADSAIRSLHNKLEAAKAGTLEVER